MKLSRFLAPGATGSVITMALALAATLVPAAALNAASPTANAAPDGALLLSIGASRVVNLPSRMSDVVVADPAVADVHVRSDTQLYIIAKAPGETNLFVTAPNGKILYSGTIRVGNNLTSIDQMLKLAMPEADIQIATMNGMVLLTGTIKAPEDAAEAERLTQAFVGKDVTVVSRLRTATPLQVNLQVRFAEVNKNLAKSIGSNLMTRDTSGGFMFGIGQGNAGTITDGGNGKTLFNFNNLSGATSLGFAGHWLGMDLLSTLDLAENQGYASTLANPNLTAISGETASFLAGGEIPIPISSSLGQVSVEYKQYGVSLAFTPTVLADGRISMRVRPEVSQLSDAGSVKLSNFSIPGISTRRAETTIELGSGQSFMIGGLLSNASSNTINKAPYLGDLPILGNLFKSTQYKRQETELMIIVTPYLVKPVDANAISLPTDAYRNATDAQRIFGGKLIDGKSGGKRPMPTIAPPVTVPAGNEKSSAPKGAPAAAPGFSF